MPNHVKNVIQFKRLKAKDKEIILDMIARNIGEPLGVPEYVIDFDKIIPQPKFIEDCPEKFIKTERDHIEEDKDTPWFNWYDWRIENWGTKWDAYDAYTLIGETWIRFVFNTAWSMPYPVIEKLQLLNYDIEVRYADENIGSNCGRLTYTKDGGWTHYDEDELTDSTRFARNLWNKY